MPRCDTRYFGTVDYDPDATIVFPQALPGFIEETEFILLQRAADFPLAYLQSTRSAGLCFLTMPVQTVDPTYGLELAEEDARVLELPANPQVGADVLCLALISVHTGDPTANLFAPLVVNLRTRIAAQCFRTGTQYGCQQPLVAAQEGVAA